MTYVRQHILRRQQREVVVEGKPTVSTVKENVPITTINKLGYEIIYSGNTYDEHDLSFLYSDSIDLKKIIIVDLEYNIGEYEGFGTFNYEGIHVSIFVEKDNDNDLRFRCQLLNHEYYLCEDGFHEGKSCLFKILKFETEEALKVFLHFKDAFNF